nr:protein GPR107-like [Ipomoea batatas]
MDVRTEHYNLDRKGRTKDYLSDGLTPPPRFLLPLLPHLFRIHPRLDADLLRQSIGAPDPSINGASPDDVSPKSPLRRRGQPFCEGAPIIPTVGGIKQEIAKSKKAVDIDSSEEIVSSPFYHGSGIKEISSDDTCLSICGDNASVSSGIATTNRDDEAGNNNDDNGVIANRPYAGTKRPRTKR